MDLKELVNALHDYYEESIFVTDGEGSILFANRIAGRRLGVPCEELPGRNVRDLMEEGFYERSTVLEAIRTRKPAVGALGGNGDMEIYSNSVPVLDEEGNVTMVVTSNMSVRHNLE